MSADIRIALDAMSGDFGPRSAMLAAQKALAGRECLYLTVVGDLSVLSQFPVHPRLTIISSDECVSMSDSPAFALRHRRDSSMAECLKQVAAGRVSACVSAGNTGALVALGCHFLKCLPGISRPAICKFMPSQARRTLMLDLGANTQASPEQLLQFAIMGAALCQVQLGVEGDGVRVALLNIGVEQGKGPASLGLAAELFEACDAFRYVGFAESDQIFGAVADVVVCDGYAGNIALKACEGTAKHIAQVVEGAAGESLLARFQALLALPLLSRLRHKFAPENYNGANLLGLRGVVVKSHGGADVAGILCAINEACDQIEGQVLEKVEARLLEHGINR